MTANSGVVFSGGWEGVLRALSTADGRSLWEYNTAHPFAAVNSVAGKGGSLGAGQCAACLRAGIGRSGV
ncbi:MAG: hypothetical protein WCC21_13855 [Candidatus Acidiferrales bacterium]